MLSLLLPTALAIAVFPTLSWARFQNENDPAFKDILAEIHDSVCVGSTFNAGECATASGASISTILANAGTCDQQDAADNFINLANQGVTDPDKKARFIALAQMFLAHERNSVPDPCSKICPRPPVNPQLLNIFPAQDPACTNPPAIPDDQAAAIAAAGSSTPKPESDNKGDGNPAPNPESDNQGNGNPAPKPESDNQGDGNPAPDQTNCSNGSTPNKRSRKGRKGKKGGDEACAPTGNGNAGDDQSQKDNQEKNKNQKANKGKKGKKGGKGKKGKKGGKGGKTADNKGDGKTESSNFQCENGKLAQSADLSRSAGGSCTDGETICLSNGDFGQCDNGALVATTCGATLSCQVLPLLKKAGTSATCSTDSDREDRIKNALQTC
ncbi:hypothetical protein BASA50_004929 [Batrachochytrium salamandrivorans]|uniref:Carbohydrate-binding module family 19 domain-containing protein n=1 Tax=Batrachochytrium salamandrivorans TaxID=1357716 RepID=A0ABQ8FE69_9FUNG|nr:hypothetical protein BASA50_004929 [Batrachochytrium salamandrivorans]